MTFVLCCVLVAIIVFVSFLLGCFFMRHILYEAQEKARNDSLREQYYRLAGVHTPNDPKPYVPPVIYPAKAPRAKRFLPGMDALDRRMRESRRGTIMWRAGDRKGADAPQRTSTPTS